MAVRLMTGKYHVPHPHRAAPTSATKSARKLRSFVKTRMHSRNEQLTQFGILPNRMRPSKRRRPAEETDNPEAAEGSAAPATPTEKPE
jgi:hypothetical protein